MPAHIDLDILGSSLRLLAERAVHWPSEGALIVADVHWGKAAAFRAQAVPIPRGTTTTDADRLSALLARTGARELVILGDLFHARSGMADETLAVLRAWRARHPALAITLVRGNHDLHAGDPPADLGIACRDAPWHRGPFAFRHHPDPSDRYVLAGHVHPAVRLRGAGRQGLTLPCFLQGPDGMLLPAFGTFTGSAVQEPGPGDRVFVIADGELLEVPTRPVSPAGRPD